MENIPIRGIPIGHSLLLEQKMLGNYIKKTNQRMPRKFKKWLKRNIEARFTQWTIEIRQVLSLNA